VAHKWNKPLFFRIERRHEFHQLVLIRSIVLTSGRTGRQSGILYRNDAAGHRVWTHLSWV